MFYISEWNYIIYPWCVNVTTCTYFMYENVIWNKCIVLSESHSCSGSGQWLVSYTFTHSNGTPKRVISSFQNFIIINMTRWGPIVRCSGWWGGGMEWKWKLEFWTTADYDFGDVTFGDVCSGQSTTRLALLVSQFVSVCVQSSICLPQKQFVWCLIFNCDDVHAVSFLYKHKSNVANASVILNYIPQNN